MITKLATSQIEGKTLLAFSSFDIIFIILTWKI